MKFIRLSLALPGLMRRVANQESGIGSQESGVRSQESGVRSQESGVRSQESGVRSQESGVRSQEFLPWTMIASFFCQFLNFSENTAFQKIRPGARFSIFFIL